MIAILKAFSDCGMCIPLVSFPDFKTGKKICNIIFENSVFDKRTQTTSISSNYTPIISDKYFSAIAPKQKDVDELVKKIFQKAIDIRKTVDFSEKPMYEVLFEILKNTTKAEYKFMLFEFANEMDEKLMQENYWKN